MSGRFADAGKEDLKSVGVKEEDVEDKGQMETIDSLRRPVKGGTKSRRER